MGIPRETETNAGWRMCEVETSLKNNCCPSLPGLFTFQYFSLAQALASLFPNAFCDVHAQWYRPVI